MRGSVSLTSSIPFRKFSFLSFPFLRFAILSNKMISVLTPKMLNALDMMSHAECSELYDALNMNNDELVIRMMIAKDASLELDLQVANLMQDPLMQLLDREDIAWGDLMMLNPNQPTQSEWKLLEEDHDWVMPALTLRKHIWENFPVVVKQMDSKDGREQYAVQWHMKNFQEARDACEHGWQYMDFEEDTYRHLMKSLQASRSWTVQPAVGREDLCTIVMNADMAMEKELKPFVLPSKEVKDSDSDGDSNSVCTEDGWVEVAKKGPTVPVLRRLNDIKEHFPVVWSEVAGCSSKTYAVELFGRKIKEQGLNAAKVKADLLAALKASKSWTVLPATSDRQACQIRMNHL